MFKSKCFKIPTDDLDDPDKHLKLVYFMRPYEEFERKITTDPENFVYEDVIDLPTLVHNDYNSFAMFP